MCSTTVYQTVGNAVAQWEEDFPLKWVMQEPPRKGGLAPDEIECDLSTLTPGYEVGFLLAVKDVLVSRRHRVKLNTIQNECRKLRTLLERVHEKGFDGRTQTARIGSTFLVALHAVAEHVPVPYLKYLKAFYGLHRNDKRLFENELHLGDFPATKTKRGTLGDRVDRILSKALRRATLVHVLDVVEDAFEERRVDLGRYAFTRLALNIFCRPESYRRLTLADLRLDQSSGPIDYFLDVLPAKSGAHNPRKIAYRLHGEVGRLLAMQRQSVVEHYGHLAPQGEHGKLPLFPATKMRRGNLEWANAYANAHAGMLPTGSFSNTYLTPVKKLTLAPVSFNALRHTIGTQLAQMGCSAHTIQAVLKHATDGTSKAYVDIAFHGLIDELSDGLQPGFDEHFPVVHTFISATDTIPPERRIESEDLDTSRHETTGVCGRQIACDYAPIACYACPRFTPCYDADHSINLDIVDREIAESEGHGRAMQHDVKRWKTIRSHIRLVIAACETKSRSVEMGARVAVETSV